MQPWQPEQTLTLELARALIAAQFPQFRTTAMEVLGAGWDNTAILVDGQFVFRFPRRALGAACLENEIRVLPVLAGQLPLAIPLPEFVGVPSDRFPWPFAGYRRLAGQTACSVALDDPCRSEAAAPLGEFLAALHAVDAQVSRLAGAPHDTLGRLDPVRRIPQAQERLAQAARLGLIPDEAPWTRVVEANAAARPVQTGTLVHGDLYVRHILVDGEARPCGIIDWGDVHIGDAALDLSIAHSFLPASAHDAFRRAYGPIDESTWRLARFRALHYGAILAVYGHEAGDRDLLREGLAILKYVVQE